MDFSIVVSALLGFAIFLTFAGLDRILSLPGEAIDDRLDRYAHREDMSFTFIQDEPEEGKKGITAWLDKRMKRKSNTSGLAMELSRADLKLTPAEWTLITIVTILLMGVLGLLIFRTPVLASASAIAGFFLPR